MEPLDKIIHVEFSFSEMLAAEAISDFEFFLQISEYLHIDNKIYFMEHKSHMQDTCSCIYHVYLL